MTNIKGSALITGASGFIGTWLRERLLADGVDVIAIRRPGSPEAKVGRSVTASYSDLDALKRVMADERPDYVFHVAGVTKGRTYEDFRNGNVVPTKNLLRALEAEHPDVKRFVHISSLAAFGPAEAARPLRESDPREPIEFYGESKLEAERVVEESNVPWTIMRPSGVYGPRDVDMFELFKSAHRGVNLFFGNRHRWFSKIYVDDCVRAILDGAASDATVAQGYFLGEGGPVTWDEFQSEIVQVVDRKVRTVNLPEFLVTVAAYGGELMTRFDGKPRLFNHQKAKMGAQEAWTCHVDKAREDFGFVADVKVPEGVQKTHRWYLDNGWY